MWCSKCLRDRDEERFPLRHGVRIASLCKDCKRNYDKSYTRQPEVAARIRAQNLAIKDQVMQYYGGGVCGCCGEVDLRFLSLDHVNDDGGDHRRTIKKEGHSLYRYLIKKGFPSDPPLRVLCFNCNLGRRVNGGLCPHQEGK
jgi:hypothetical protein